ncbi:restriction endonuclease [uncultured Desulfovibrio sp.]|uniref:restriction endonuclease n=1 Tax=uncultured Desulfovibrio sp. TaxID=167968 RepID=UPI002615AAF3|nr:restriction endonuclease [uncultured Desulfovibrio sp.]
MSIPKYNELYRPLLEYIRDGQPRTTAELEEVLAKRFSLTDIDRQERLSSGTLTFCNRIAWARTYLKKAGLVTSPKRGTVQITPEGKAAVDDAGLHIDNDFLATFPSFAEFQKGGQTTTNAENRPTSTAEDEDSPQDSLDRAYTRIRQTLAEDVLAEIMRQTPTFFEQLVVRLLQVMGYGGSLENAGTVTRASGDEGIDGIVKQDKLGFDQIYIQAKRWDPTACVGRPDIQKFVGALAGQGATRGLFVTTAKFSEEAHAYARKQHTTKIVLVDGQRLAELMIDHNLGVTPIARYEIKRIDSDFFTDTD